MMISYKYGEELTDIQRKVFNGVVTDNRRIEISGTQYLIVSFLRLPSLTVANQYDWEATLLEMDDEHADAYENACDRS